MKKVWTFFYGSYMNFNVLKEVDIVPEEFEVAKLNGFDIRIQPLANLVPSNQHCVYRIMATVTHEELERLYVHAQDVLGGTYFPEAVLVETMVGKWIPALCYIAPSMEPKPPDDEYIDRMLGAGAQWADIAKDELTPDDKKARSAAWRAEGIQICIELIQQVREIEGVAGVHIMAIEWEEAVGPIAEGAGLLPRPTVAVTA